MIGDTVYYPQRASSTDEGQLVVGDYFVASGRIVSYDDGPIVVVDNGIRLAFVKAKYVNGTKHMVTHLCDDLNAGRETVGFSHLHFSGDA